MALPTRSELSNLADDTGYPVDTLEVVTRLLDLLQAIAQDPLLGEHAALTGGTALNGFHSNWQRLSVDIDLTYIRWPQEGGMLAARSQGDSALRRILADKGYRVLQEPIKRGGGKWKVGFDALAAEGGRLEIDLGYVERIPLLGSVRRPSAPLGSRVASDMLVLDKREVIAGKMRALFMRGKLRDIFDGWRILSDENLDWRVIKAVFLAKVAASRHDPRGMTVDWIQADPGEDRDNLRRCLPADAFNGTPIERWIEETVEICRQGFARLVDWNADEREFLDGVWERGEINAGLLDAGGVLRLGIDVTPPLVWRCEKVLEEKATQERVAEKRAAQEREREERVARQKAAQERVARERRERRGSPGHRPRGPSMRI